MLGISLVKMQGKPAELLVDSGASCTLVCQDLAEDEKMNRKDKLHIRYAHGDSVVYPTANIEININNQIYNVHTGVSSTLPRPVLLGQDIGNLLELTIQEQAYTVLMRRSKKRLPSPKKLYPEFNKEESMRKTLAEDDQIILHQLDNSIFEGEPKPRKTKRERRQAKKVQQSDHS